MACDSPYYVLPKAGTEKVPVPCGRCPPCKKRRVDSWVFRLMQHEKTTHFSHFVTLTYDNAHVPISPNGFMTLRKSDFQLYMKRLRKLEHEKISYYVAGEYGSTTFRPHYHAIVFGVSDPENFIRAWSVDSVPIGGVHVGSVSGDSIGYTMKYIDKPNFSRKHARDDRAPEFSLMSKKLGANFLTPEMVRFYRDDMSRMAVFKPGGDSVAMPRYYREKIFSEAERRRQSVVIADAVLEEQRKRELEFKRENPNGDFQQFLDNARMERYRRFYYRQKSARQKI